MPGGTPSSPGLAAHPAVVPGAAAQAAQGCADAGAAGHPGRRRRGRAGRLRHREPHREPLLHAAGHRPGREEHDPGVLLRPAAHQRRRLAARGHRQDADQEDRRARRGHDGRGHRLRLGQGRLRRRAQGRHASRPRRRARATRRSSRPRRSSAARPPRRSPRRCWTASRRPPTRPTSRASTSSSRPCSRASELKHKVFQEIEDIVEPNALLGSNTSTLPITGLATGVKRQEDFIGIHFFSPVDKMPLVEIIKGEKTSDEALARVFDYTLAIGKTPIVVNDSRGFFTRRVIGTFVNEALGHARRGCRAGQHRAGRSAGRLPGAAAAAVRRAQPRADAQDRDVPPARASRTRAAPTSRTRPRRSSRR